MKGIDIAKWNPVQDYKAVSEQVSFAVLKIINKQNNEDGLFSTHLTGCRKNNIPIYGVYNYSYASTLDKARSDAAAVISALRRHDLKTIVWMDVEENDIAKRIGRTLGDVIRAYRDVIESAGYTFGIYTGLSYYNSFIQPCLDKIGSANMWIARYPSSSPMTIGQEPPANKKPIVYGMMAWQYTSKGQISGIKGNVDLSVSELTEEDWDQRINSNIINIDIKPTLHKGDTNDYVRAWQMLLNQNGYNCGNADGIFGNQTEKAVIRWQQDHGMEAGYIGEKTWETI